MWKASIEYINSDDAFERAACGEQYRRSIDVSDKMRRLENVETAAEQENQNLREENKRLIAENEKLNAEIKRLKR